MDKVINLTADQVKELCPTAYKELVDHNAEFEDSTPIGDIKFWLCHHSVWSTTRDASKDPSYNQVPAYPGYSLNLQDPADDGFFNVSLVWDGEMWG
jgi:hypothetical protein